MSDAPVTRPSLLLRIRDGGDSRAWSQFAEVYAPMIYGYARKHGLQDADAADLAQEAMQTVHSAIRSFDYDSSRGTFRGWLFTVVRNKLRDWLDRQAAPGRGTGATSVQELLAQQPADGDDQLALWNAEWQRQVYAWAAEQVRSQVEPATWLAFEETAVRKSGKEAAAQLGMSVAAVYLAKSRVMARLKEMIKEVEDLG